MQNFREVTVTEMEGVDGGLGGADSLMSKIQSQWMTYAQKNKDVLKGIGTDLFKGSTNGSSGKSSSSSSSGGGGGGKVAALRPL